MVRQTDSQPANSRGLPKRRRVLIVGGVAGGASCAARLRRLDESVEILMFDCGPYVSFANCGLPYYVGNVIADENRLLVAARAMFCERFNIEVHTDTEVTSIDRSACARGFTTYSEGTECFRLGTVTAGARQRKIGIERIPPVSDRRAELIPETRR